MKRFCVTVILILSILASSCLASTNIYYGDYNPDLLLIYIDVPIIAISTDLSLAILGQVRIGLIENGNSKLIFDSRTQIDDSTILSVIDAISYAESKYGSGYDYFISYDLSSIKVSGKSTGSAIALGLISLLGEKGYNYDYISTGSVDKEGNMIETGGIEKKIFGINTLIPNLLIPLGQSELTVYEKHRNNLIGRNFNLTEFGKSEFGLNVIEVGNLDNVLSFALKEKI